MERDSGIDLIGTVPWGTHFGLFYKTKQDLIDFYVPYFVAGLKNNEFCLWVTAEPLTADEAKACMAEALPDFDAYMEKGQIEIISYTEWYTVNGSFEPEHVLNGWVEKLRNARERGFSGLRLTGNESWLEPGIWKDFIDYEQRINDVIGQYDMLAVCAYALEKCDAGDILDVVSTHQFALSRRNGDWKIVEDQGQKKARKALRESEAELARAQRISRIGSWTWDLMTGEITWSDESYRNYGLAPGEVKPTYELFLSFIVPEDRPRVDQQIRRAIENGDTYNIIYRIIRKDGAPRILLSENEVIRNRSGKVVRMSGTNQDITERKRAEEELRKLSRAVEESPVTVVITDAKGDIEYVNPRFTQLTGYTFEEAKGRNPRILKSGHTSQETYRHLWHTILSGKEWRGEFKNRKKNGDIYRESAVIAPIKDAEGRITHFIAIKEDITKLKKAQDLIKEERQRLFSLLDSLPAYVYLQARDHSIRFVNQNFRKIFGEPEGRPCYEVIQCRDKPCPDCPTFKVFDIHRPQQWEWTNAAGNTYQVYDYPFKDTDGTPLVLEMGIDITGRKQMEEALSDAKAQVELYLDLMSHDINNLNHVALGYLELIHEAVEDEEIKELVSQPIEAVNNSTHLIENVRKLQKARTGQYKAEAVDLNKVLSELRAQYSRIPGRDVAIRYTHHSGCVAMADGLIKDVFSNLIWNAIKHSDGKSVQVDVELKRQRIDGKEYCRVAVEDDGPGIPDGQKEKVFARFQRGNTKAGGKGLGLYLVKTLVEGYRGRVWAEDRIRGDHTKGARFIVMLPATEK